MQLEGSEGAERAHEGGTTGAASDRNGQRAGGTDAWSGSSGAQDSPAVFTPSLNYLLTFQEKRTYITGVSGGRVIDSLNSKRDFVIRPSIFQRAHV